MPDLPAFYVWKRRLESQPAFEEERRVFLEALEESLRPLMRAVFAYGVNYNDLVDSIRATYISAVREREAARGRVATDARLAVMSGVTRGEVVTMQANRRDRQLSQAETAERVDEYALLLGKWHDDPRFSTPYGAPLDLSLQPEGSFRLFDDLVAATGLKVVSEKAISILQDAGCVEVHENRFVRCLSRSFSPTGRDLSKISRMGRVVGALHTNFVHNLLRDSGQASYFEKTLVTDFPISENGRNEFLAHVRVEGEEFVHELDRWVATKSADHKDEDGRRYGVATFFFEDSPRTKLGTSEPIGAPNLRLA